MRTVVEFASYLKKTEKLFSEQERDDIVLTLAGDPECGEVMRGAGGFRKVHFAMEGEARAAALA